MIDGRTQTKVTVIAEFKGERVECFVYKLDGIGQTVLDSLSTKRTLLDEPPEQKAITGLARALFGS